MTQATLPALTKEKKARLVMGVINVQDKEPGCDRRVEKARVSRSRRCRVLVASLSRFEWSFFFLVTLAEKGHVTYYFVAA